MKYKILSLPIETKNREFLGKLLLSAKAADNGWIVFLGRSLTIKQAIYNFLPGVHVFTSIPEHKYEKYLLPYAEFGHKMINICEESVQYFDGKDYCDRKVGTKALSLTSQFLAVGKRQADHVKKYRNIRENQLVITGNHRFDLLRPGFRNVYADDANRIKNKFGKFILVNTNFAKCNPHPDYGDRLATLKNKNYISNAEQEAIWHALVHYKVGLMREFMEFIPQITTEFNCKVVVRPHPSENHDTWKRWAENKKNIIVAHDGSANQWMMAAEAVIHNGCTTGVEGFLLGRPMIAYVSDPDNKFSKDIVNDVSLKVHNEKELLDAVEKALRTGRFDNEQERHEKINRLKYYVENADGPPACDLIVKTIGMLDVPEHSLKDVLNSFNGFASLIFHAKSFVKKSRHLFMKKETNDALRYQKFFGISLEEMEKPLEVWKNEKIISSIPKIKQIKESMFCLYKVK